MIDFVFLVIESVFLSSIAAEETITHLTPIFRGIIQSYE